MRMCSAFAGQGHEVLLVHRPGSAEHDIFAHYGVEPQFQTLSKPWGPLFGAAQYSLSIVRDQLIGGFRPELIYGRCVPAIAASIYRWRLPFILEVHAPPSTIRRKYLERFVIDHPLCQSVVCISEALQAEYKCRFPTSGKFRIAHDGADIASEDVSMVSSVDQNKVFTGSEPLDIGYVGSLYRGKGVEVVGALAGRMSRDRFTVVGGSPEQVDCWKEQFPYPNIEWRGFVSPQEAVQCQRRFDVLLMPPLDRVCAMGNRGDIAKWMSPLKLFEYMSSGVPIVASDIPVLREILEQERNCLLASPTDISAWERAVDRLRSDVALRRSLADAALDDLRQRYTWATRVSNVLHGTGSHRVA